MLKLYSVSDCYISYLRSEIPNVYDSHVNHRTHTRKYVGVLVFIKGFNYLIPLSSPKPSDFEDNGSIKPSTLTILRIIKRKKRRTKLLSTLRISHMIPVPESELAFYDANKENDNAYKELVLDELRWIEHNDNMIKKKAKTVYYLKKNEATSRNEKNFRTLLAILPFTKLEILCKEWTFIKRPIQDVLEYE